MDGWLRPGVLLDGKYRIEQLIGQGGMGVVARATHVAFGDPVAIKFLRPEYAANEEVVRRFLREGRASRQIQNAHVVQVTDVGTTQDGAPYLVMEFLEGEDLGARLARTGPFAPVDGVEVLLQACEAIAEAHAVGIVHRDLKPGNLFAVVRRGAGPFIKVLDFGISKVSAGGAHSGALTGTHVTVGSPLYMSPEQLNSARDVDARSDIWALGVILYELVTARRPFEGDDLPRLCVQILAHPHTPLRSRNASLPGRLASVIDRCLEKDRERRFASVADFARALEPFTNERSRVSMQNIAAAEGPAPAVAPASSVPFASSSPSRRSDSHPSVRGVRSGRHAATATGVAFGAPEAPRGRSTPWMIVAGTLAVLAAGGVWAAWSTFAVRPAPAAPPASASSPFGQVATTSSALAPPPAPVLAPVLAPPPPSEPAESATALPPEPSRPPRTPPAAAAARPVSPPHAPAKPPASAAAKPAAPKAAPSGAIPDDAL